MTERRAWLGAGAVFVGLGAALLVGPAVAAADEGPSDGGASSSQSSSHDSSGGASQSASQGSSAPVGPAATGESGAASNPASVPASVKKTGHKAPTAVVSGARSSTVKTTAKVTSSTAAAKQTAEADDANTAATGKSQATDTGTAARTTSNESSTTDDVAATTAKTAATTALFEAEPAASTAPAKTAHKPGPVATLVLNTLSAFGWAPRAEAVEAIPALAPWSRTTGSAASQPTALAQPTISAAADSSNQSPLLPAGSNGVTGVKVGTSDLTIPVGTKSLTAKADWYLPTQVDGSVQANGVVWLQHGFLANKSFYTALATNLAQQTNSIVVAPSLPSFPSLRCGSCYLSSPQMAQGVADLFLGTRDELNASAGAAGFVGTLPESFTFTGHSAGGGLAVAAAGYAVDNGAAANGLQGVVMFDGVTLNNTLPTAIASLNTAKIPVYQIAAPAQTWNAFGMTTDELLSLRPNEFDGVVLIGGSHVDSMLGTTPIIDFAAQLVTKRSPAGNTAAVYTFANGWINDFYADGSPIDPKYGFYGPAGQQLIMGDAAAVVLPTPLASQLSPLDQVLQKITSAVFALVFGTSSASTATIAPTAGLAAPTSVITPSQTNGVTGVKVGHSDLDIPVGTSGYTAPADWYLPTQADGTVQANGTIWLQHGFLANKTWYAALAMQLAQQTNSIVVAPTLLSFPLSCAGCFLNGVAMQQAIATMFEGSRPELTISANAAGYNGNLPDKFILSGHSAGGGLAAAVGGFIVDNGSTAADDLLGVVMFDGVSGNGTFDSAIASLDTRNIPVYQIAAPPQSWNANGQTTTDLVNLRPGQFVGDVLANGSHVDSLIGAIPLIDFVSQLLVKDSPPGNTDAVYTLSTGWINDMYAGRGPGDPKYGIYGEPDQYIPMGQTAAIVLGPPPVVDIDDYLGTWYEVGSVKLPFAWGLVNTTAQYSLNPDGSIRVQNSGNYFFNNGPESNIVGSAVSVDPDNNKLNVAFFFGPPSDNPPGNYWIVDLAPDYSWSIVSDPTGFSGFLLSRTRTVTPALYQELLDRASAQGVNSWITPTRQPAAG